MTLIEEISANGRIYTTNNSPNNNQKPNNKEYIMKLYNRCTNIIREKRYVGKYYSINEYQCYNKVIAGYRCRSCKGDA